MNKFNNLVQISESDLNNIGKCDNCQRMITNNEEYCIVLLNNHEYIFCSDCFTYFGRKEEN